MEWRTHDMNMLDYLAKKKGETMLLDEHPFANASSSFKTAYCFGLAVLVYGYKDQIPVTVECFSSILSNIHFDLKQQEILATQVKKNFEIKISNTFQKITTKNEQYCFIADLYRISFFGLISPTFSRDIIEGYCQVFNFSSEEKAFLTEFCELGYKTTEQLRNNSLSYYDTKLDKAIEAYKTFMMHGYSVSTTILQYIYPAFSISYDVEDFKLDDGSILRYESNLHIKGTFTISNCSTVVIDHAKVTLDGSINVNNGKIIIRNSHVIVNSCPEDYAIFVENSPIIKIEDSIIDCKQKAGFLFQNSGQLRLQATTISNTPNVYAISFYGNSAEIITSTFENCHHGALSNNATRELFIASTNFINCHNKHGGAIHSRSLVDVTVYNCTFQNCHADYIGAAVYFSTLNFGQSVLGCHFDNCTPTDSILFNQYDNKLIDTGLI
jgi:hypothetical protein